MVRKGLESVEVVAACGLGVRSPTRTDSYNTSVVDGATACVLQIAGRGRHQDREQSHECDESAAGEGHVCSGRPSFSLSADCVGYVSDVSDVSAVSAGGGTKPTTAPTAEFIDAEMHRRRWPNSTSQRGETGQNEAHHVRSKLLVQ